MVAATTHHDAGMMLTTPLARERKGLKHPSSRKPSEEASYHFQTSTTSEASNAAVCESAKVIGPPGPPGDRLEMGNDPKTTGLHRQDLCFPYWRNSSTPGHSGNWQNLRRRGGIRRHFTIAAIGGNAAYHLLAGIGNQRHLTAAQNFPRAPLGHLDSVYGQKPQQNPIKPNKTLKTPVKY